MGKFTSSALVVVYAVAAGCAFFGTAWSAENAPPWRDLEQEAVSTLSRYIQVDTTNPPGNEIKAAQFFKEIFDREGIEAKIIESAPGRGNVYARLRGDGSKKALVLLNHLDVVPAEPKEWQQPPFGGVVKDGYVWGRGALDMKGPAVAQAMTLIALKRQKILLKADVIFLGTADEEAGGALGAGFLLERHPNLFSNVGLVLNEGGGIRMGKDGKAVEYRVSVSEKTPLWLRLTATGKPGHGSTPGDNLAVNKLLAALNRVIGYQSPIKVVPEVQKYYADIANGEQGERQVKYQDLQSALQDPLFAAEFTKDARNNASVRNTISITGLKGSDKVNVIPAEAIAEIDVRLLPGEDPQAFINQLKRVVSDDTVKIDVILSFPPATSPPHPEAKRVITEMAKSRDGEVPVVSPLVRGFTDCHFFRGKKIPCFGFMPLRNPASEGGLVHGIDERITVESLGAGLRGLYEVVHQLAAK
ncbi:MAG: M20/M25/M40 family metallo-hydrolase [Deltaproteobacteria bacterium]|nr:M20/M25/M40 family metallo-hydrolase [Deltaproteobacteria bacterium]